MAAPECGRRLDVTEALCAEFAVLHGKAVPIGARPAGSAASAAPELSDYRAAVHHLAGGQSALCLSGGGVRSAAFSLGVLQGLARRRLLSQFHYLSTVSGGGYIGSWLTAWAHREAARAEAGDGDAQSGFQSVETSLNSRPAKDGGEATPLTWLRKNQRFLSPRAGMMSADLWAGVALFLRDLVLNWIVYLPAIASVLLLPRVLEFLLVFWTGYAAEAGSGFGWLIQGGILNTLRAVIGQPVVHLTAPRWQGLIDVAGALLVLLGMRFAMIERTQTAPDRAEAVDDRAFRRWILAPIMLGGFLLVMFNAAILAQGATADLTLLAQWCVGTPAIFVLARLFAAPGAMPRIVPLTGPVRQELLMLAVSGVLVGAAVWFGLRLRSGEAGGDATVRDFVVFGLPYLLLAFVFGQTIYAGLSSLTAFGRRDQEWLGRASGHYLLAAVSWAAMFGLILYGQPLQGYLPRVAAVSGTAGALTLGAAFSALTKARDAVTVARGWLSGAILLKAGLFVFLAGACIGLAAATNWLIWQATGVDLGAAGDDLARHLQGALLPPRPDAPDPGTIFLQARYDLVLAVVGSLLLLAASLLASVFVDVNVFSLHGLYRTRLIRTFLGASNAKDPARNRFDGFAEHDDIPLAQIWRNEAGAVRREGPFPVLNIALNLVGSKDLAVQDRKAEPFVATPLHYGAETVGYIAHDPARRRGNLSLGTAMAISGAAASPNWGYHSSPLVGFLLMLFNLRLGWWIENPRCAGQREDDGGRSFRLFRQEALGQTSDTDPYVYLSDGGHFDNLGIYEMFRRRCSLIVCVDGSQDQDYTLDDLGRALRSAAVDLGVTVQFEPIHLRRRVDPAAAGVYAALGAITYPERADPQCPKGTFIYIKPGFLDDAPVDVRAYAAANAKFPHDSTLNQFFSEPQFESYRALGSHVIDRVCGPPRHLRTSDLHGLVETYLQRTPVSSK